VVVQEDSTHAVRDVPVAAGRVLCRISRPTPRLARGIGRTSARLLTGDELRMRGASASARVNKEVGDLCTRAQLGFVRAARSGMRRLHGACRVPARRGGLEGDCECPADRQAWCAALTCCTLQRPTCRSSVEGCRGSIVQVRCVYGVRRRWRIAQCVNAPGPYRRRTAAACHANPSRPCARLKRQI
jgi:hypothetical protein